MSYLRGKIYFVGAALACATGAFAQSSLGSTSIVGVNNDGTYIYSLDQQSVSDTSAVTAHSDSFFTGKDGNGNIQTMEFNGTTTTQSTYGQLHSYATGTVTNSYYNTSNSPYVLDKYATQADTSGSPTTLCSLGFSTFNDTLTFGGSLQPGYEARYIFHVDGTNTGYGVVSDLAFNIGNQSEGFFAFDQGYNDDIWATKGYSIDTPQSLNIQFSNQFVLNTWEVADGSTITGTSNFSETLTLAGIMVVDSSGAIVDPSLWTVSSDSGTSYTKLSTMPVPEPSSLFTLGGAIGLLGLKFRRRTR